MRIEQLLKDSYAAADNTPVTLTMTTTVGELRSASDAFDQATLVSFKLGAAAPKRTPAKKAAAKTPVAKKAAPKKASSQRKPAATSAAAKRKPAAAAKTNASTSAPKRKPAAAAKAKASKAATTPTPTAATSAPSGRVKQEAVLAAIRDGHKTPAAIAKAVNGDQRQISKALSRYTKTGLITREGIGVYGIAAGA